MSRQSKRRSTLGRAVARGVYVALLSAGLLALAELAARLVAEDPDNALSRNRLESRAYAGFAWRDAYAADLAGGADVRALVYEPFSLWKHRDVASPTINVAGGYRATWQPPPAPDAGERELFAFGGSTLFGGEGPDEHTIASYLAKQLAAGAPGRVLVRNFGVSGFTSDNEVHLLVELLRRRPPPRAAIFYDGANDVYNKVARGQPHYLYDNFAQLGRYSFRGALARLARRSRLVRLLSPAAPAGEIDADAEELEQRAEAMLADYLANVDFVRRLAASYGFDAHFFWQPNLFDAGKTLAPEERDALEASAHLAPVHAAVRRHLDRSGALAAAGVVDLAGALDATPDPVFLDPYHVTAVANEAIAERISAALLAGQDHALPQPGQPAGAAEADHPEALAREQP